MSAFLDELEESLPDLWRYAFSLCHDRALADDLVQDCAERALRKRVLLIPGRKMKPWLMKILLNVYRNQLQKERRFHPVELDRVGGREESLQVPSGVGDRLELVATARGLALLPAEQREALLAIVVGGMDYADAARALDIPVGTLMSRVSRARKKLRQVSASSETVAFRSVK